MEDLSRREFITDSAKLSAGAALGLGALQGSTASWAGANDKIRAAVIGIRGRGQSHMAGLSRQDNVEVVALCDADSNLYEERVNKHFVEKGLPKPAFVQDLRKVIEDESIDVVSIATPNHWHSLATIWALEAGKHVYVEKPISHNVYEGRQLVETAKRTGKVVQHGIQARSNPAIQEAIQKLREGVIGDVYMARGLCYRWRGPIGKTPDSAPPQGVDYDLWLGPAPERPFSQNRFHYNWHYHWDYGNGDIGNQGVHHMDLARWGLDVELPSQISSMGGMFLFDDDKEVPNVITSSFSFPEAGPRGKMLVFDVRPWSTNDEKGARTGVIFYGSLGYLVLRGYSEYQVYLCDGNQTQEVEGPGRKDGNFDHFKNFIEAVRQNDPDAVSAPPEGAHYSAALAHLGLMSAKLGRQIEFDPETESVIGDEEATGLLTRTYRKPFVVPGAPSL